MSVEVRGGPSVGRWAAEGTPEGSLRRSSSVGGGQGGQTPRGRVRGVAEQGAVSLPHAARRPDE